MQFGRMNYIVSLTVDYVLKEIENDNLSDKCLNVIRDDIKSAKRYGMEMDKREWFKLLKKIEEVIQLAKEKEEMKNMESLFKNLHYDFAMENMLKFFHNFSKNFEEENRKLSKIDKELSDLDHYIELNDLKESKMIKVITLRKSLRQKRREIKNNISNLQIVKNFVDEYNNELMITDDITKTLKEFRKSAKKRKKKNYKYKTDILKQIK